MSWRYAELLEQSVWAMLNAPALPTHEQVLSEAESWVSSWDEACRKKFGRGITPEEAERFSDPLDLVHFYLERKIALIEASRLGAERWREQTITAEERMTYINT